jgi:alpha-L-fucosidase 2
VWWKNFWGKSFVEIPDKKIQDNWYGSLYLLACCSRADIPAPGLWHNFVTRTGASWNGDYTLDYNYQAPFWAGYVSNHFELTDSYEPVLLDHMERGRAIARNAWRIHPNAMPKTLEATLAARTQVKPEPNPDDYRGIYLYTHLIPMPGWSADFGTFWGQKSNALFCTVNMIQRWRLSRDLDYARKVYPFLLATAEFWDRYLVLQNGHYAALKDAIGEGSGDNVNPATTLSFLRLLYPSLIEISTKLSRDQDRRAQWHEIFQKLSPFTVVPANTIKELQQLGPDAVKDRMVIRNCEVGPGFPLSPFLLYKDRQRRSTSAGMNCTQVIFPGWSLGVESTPQERKAALDTVTLAAEWYDNNNNCTFYPSAAAAGYDPKEILENLRGLIDTYQEPNFMIYTHGGGTEDDAIIPCCLAYMFLQSHQQNIHLFPNWPMDQDASFGNLNACGGFLIGSAVKQGRIPYVQVVSQAGEECRMANPWPGHSVSLQGGEENQRTLRGEILKFPTQKGQTYLLRSGS